LARVAARWPLCLRGAPRGFGLGTGKAAAHTPCPLENPATTLQAFAGLKPCARLVFVDVVLRKLGRKGGRVVAGRLVRAPRSGSVVVIEFPDGLHEYVTTPVKRVLRLAGDDVFFLQTANSCYRLEVRSGQEVMLDSIAK
jgi:hypothetical protein